MRVSAVALGLAISIPLANAYTGDLTHYTPGLGSCGITNQNGDAIVALSVDLMNNPTKPNSNPICGKQISIHNPITGTDTTATVTDTCVGCAFSSIDVPSDLFYIIAPSGNGRVHGIQWTPIGWTVPGGSGESESSAAQPSASPTRQPSPSAAGAAALPSVQVQEKVAVAAPSTTAPAASSNTPAVPPSVAPPLPSAASSSAASAPTGSSATCTTPGESVCSADGTQIGTCTMGLTVQMEPVAPGTKCEGGYLVMANSRLRRRRA